MTSDRPEDIPKHLQQELLKNLQVQGNLTTGDITQIGSQFVIYPDKSPKPTGIPQNLPRSGVSNFVGREEAELEVAESLCEWLGYLPLGLELVGRYLAIEEDLSLAEIQQQLAQARLEDEALVEAQPEMTAQLGVAAAFELSWKCLDEYAQVLGYLLSLFALAPISWSLVENTATGKTLKDLQKARRALVQFNLIKRTEKDTYQFHQLIREFFSAKREQSVEADDLKRGFCQTMVAVAKQIPERPTQKEIAAATPTIPHIAEAAIAQKNYLRDEDSGWPFVGLGRFYEGQGAYELAEPWREQCLSTTRERLGLEHDYVAGSLNNLAGIYKLQGRYEEAEPLYLEAVALYKQLLGEDHPNVATTLHNLAGLHKLQGRYEEAEFLYLKAVALYKQLLGEDHPDVATSLDSLAVLYLFQGRYEAAEPLFIKALELYKKLVGLTHPDIATSFHNLGSVYKLQGRYQDAESSFIKALELYKQLLGLEHPDVAMSLNNLARLYKDQGRYEEAEPLFIQALGLYKQLLGLDHPNVAMSLNNLAGLYFAQGREDKAESLLVQALEIAKHRLGENHPYTVGFTKNLQKLRGDRTS